MKLILLVFSFFLISCGSMSAVRQGKESAKTKEYNISFERAWAIAAKIARELGPFQEEKLKERKQIVLSVDKGYVSIWVDKKGDSCSVSVYTRKGMVTYLTMAISERQFFKRFERYMKLEDELFYTTINYL